jgi:LemA protein
MQKKWIVLGGLVLLAVVLGGSCVHGYNKLVVLDQDVKGAWAEVENAYQRRADLIPNLVATVKGAADFEKSTYIAVADARSQAAKVKLSADDLTDPAKLKAFEAAQGNVGSALSRLMVVAEQYPDLKATQSFRDLQAQLEGTENRIAVARQRFNEASQQFNTTRNSFPTTIMAGFFGGKFNEKAFFSAKAGSDEPPKVQF